MALIMLERFQTQDDLASNAIVIFVLLVLEIPHPTCVKLPAPKPSGIQSGT